MLVGWRGAFTCGQTHTIVEARDGRWAAFEIKLGFHQVEEASAGLHKFVKRIDTSRCGPPAALGVIVGSGYDYHREDGVHVIPIGGAGTVISAVAS